MKKVIALFLVAVMSLSIVACGGKETETAENEKDIVEKIQNEEAEGFVPNQSTEKIEEMDEEELKTKDLKKYYDTKKYTGEPKLINFEFALMEDTNEFCVIINGVLNSFPNDGRIKSGVSYDCIIVDNTVVYIFTE